MIKEKMMEFLKDHHQEGYFLADLETKFYNDVEDDPNLVYLIPFGNMKNNIVAWITPKKQFSDDIMSLGNAKKIILEAHTNPLLWMTSTKLLNLPMAKKDRPYKNQHWLPCFVKIPTDEDLKELGVN